jgi:hypothetical protein
MLPRWEGLPALRLLVAGSLRLCLFATISPKQERGEPLGVRHTAASQEKKSHEQRPENVFMALGRPPLAA